LFFSLRPCWIGAIPGPLSCPATAAGIR
jgi:hypothetical protein